MRLNLVRLLAAAALLVVAVSHGAAAEVVTMDSFSATGPAGNTLFTDPFNLTGTLSGSVFSGVSTTTSPSNKVNYNVTGSFSESGGTATLDTANGALQASSPPFDPLDQQVAVSLAGGVTKSSVAGATGIFYVSVPTTVGALYGVELIDINGGHNGDVIALRVVETASGAEIEFVNVDHFDNTLTVIDSASLAAGNDEIALTLLKASAANGGAITASYDYVNGGVAGTVTTFTDTTVLASDGATLVTPGFNALAPVPEPGTLALFGSCLVALGWTLRRKRTSA